MERNKRIKHLPEWLKKSRKNYLARLRRYAKKHNISLALAEFHLTEKAEHDAQCFDEDEH